MFNKQLDKVIKAAGSVYALWILAIISFLESAFLPVPVDPFALPIMMANRRRLWQAAIIASLASVAGGCFGYFIGAYLADSFGAWIIDAYNLETQFETFKSDVKDKGAWMIAVGAISPIPYKIVAIAAGVVKFSLPVFFAVSIVCRTLRFFAFAGAIYYLGPSFERLLKQRVGLVTAILIFVTIAGFAALYFLR
jgi:membrane protein YqaA with SNARE-associated domain